MDERRFDALTKALVAAKPSRREALRRLAGGALATVFGGVALKGASAQVGIQAKTCGQFCRVDGDCNAGLQCGESTERCYAETDSKRRCDGNGDCPLHYETCNKNGRCVNTLAPRDCDECRRTGDCEDAGRVCSNGRCIVPECTSNSQCSRRKRCRQFRCVRRD